MAKFSFTDPETGKEFKITAPEGATLAQAQAVFQKQLDAGSLIGLKPGSPLSSGSQLAGGLTSALSQVTQGAAGFGGTVSGVIQGALNKTNLSASALPGGLTGVFDSAKSVASQTLGGITNAVKNFAPGDGIGFQDFAKQAPALAGIGGLKTGQVTAALSQASKIVGQVSSTVSNTLGVGKFGFDAPQLESAGLLKPGTASSFLASGASSLTSVLKSPTVWTGKDGISSVSSLLSSVPTQDKIQQSLMSTGLSGVKELGIPTGKLSPGALAGTALNAAKSVAGTFDWAKGGAALPAGLKAAYDKVSADANFAVKFSDTKVDGAMKQLTLPIPAIDTANRELIDAASKRIVGNSKVPETSYTTPQPRYTSQGVSTSFDRIRASWNDLADRSEVILGKSDKERAPTLGREISILRNILGDAYYLDGQALAAVREAKAAGDTGLQSQIEAYRSNKIANFIEILKSAILSLEETLAKAYI
jgi:hypothetical protein